MNVKQQIPFVSELDEFQTQQWLDHLQEAMPEIEIRHLHQENQKEFVNCEVAVVANPDVALLSSLPELKWVQSLWAGVESIITALPPHVGICRMKDSQLQSAMSEAVLAWTLCLHRHMHLYQQQQIQKTWLQHPWQPASKTKVAVLGLGRLGTAACERLRDNDFTVMGWSRSAKNIRGVKTYEGTEGLTRVLGEADIVVLLLPLTTGTYRLFDSATFSQMKPGASLINFARGGIIEDSALIKALKNKHVAHAVLDVFDQEPLPPEHPLWDLDNVTILPHISAPTNMTTASFIAAKNISSWLHNGQLPEMVNRDTGY